MIHRNSTVQQILFLILILQIIACKGQVETQAVQKAEQITKTGPKRIGLAPHLGFHQGPNFDTTLVSQYIRCIYQDSKGNHWFGPAGQSVVRYDKETLRYYSRNEFYKENEFVTSDYGNTVHAIAEDHDGMIWFGTDKGLIRYNGEEFKSYGKKDGLSDLWIGRKSILVDQSGKIWVGTKKGINLYDAAADKLGKPCFSTFDKIAAIHVMDIMEDDAGQIWFASEKQGLFIYDGKTVTNISTIPGLGNNVAGGMAQDKDGNYWFTMEGGICKYDGESFTQITQKDGLGGSEIWGLYLEKSGILWVTARGSTTRFDPSIPLSDSTAFKVFTVQDGLNCCVQSMHQDRDGNMWWGTGQGLYRFDSQDFYQVKQHGPWD